MDARVGVALAAAFDVQGMVAINPSSGAAAIRQAAPAKRTIAVGGGSDGGGAGAGDSGEGVESSPFDDDDGPIWPDEATESAMLAEQRGRAGEEPIAAPAKVRKKDEDDEPETMRGNLPPLDELVARLPSDVRATLEELFRAKFVRVTRVPKAVLKGEQG